MLDQDTLNRYRQDIIFDAELCGHRFTFHTTWGIFSPREIDEGTRLLLDHLEIAADDDCLDIGCGYGPIGLTLGALAPAGQTLMVDKDFMAVEYANANAARNRIGNARAQLSNGFAHIDPALRFDLIASNIPAKVGKEMLSLILHDAWARLNPGGRLYLVTINGLRQYMKRNLNEVFGNYKKLKQGKSYTVALAHKE
ncbi:class I SAM-dependent methyltransferase [Candidatus Endoriftia persephone]|jgi:16S rRNA G1207 methylase RsmC|uniref:Methyltransferase small n=3 Tax=Gammaproteobacteria TaxID=1236 RepID=G2FCH0_9GAMM|nr:methyltransferase [Candidatus Endoriftia persephone]EGV50364.1 methyltransferase small [endosymbiont of Riftia pachyptila (vent Ph05)]EGW55533.1 methyltransferase small [endosymbiont of Tevnia jerichonana (vent Tica)]USF86683.1 methyltransferase [Candidatus Endoriftia persephone]